MFSVYISGSWGCVLLYRSSLLAVSLLVVAADCSQWMIALLVVGTWCKDLWFFRTAWSWKCCHFRLIEILILIHRQAFPLTTSNIVYLPLRHTRWLVVMTLQLSVTIGASDARLGSHSSSNTMPHLVAKISLKWTGVGENPVQLVHLVAVSKATIKFVSTHWKLEKAIV